MSTRVWPLYRTLLESDLEPKAVFGIHSVMEQDPKAWEEGFKAGEERKTRCPYPEGSCEAKEPGALNLGFGPELVPGKVKGAGARCAGQCSAAQSPSGSNAVLAKHSG